MIFEALPLAGVWLVKAEKAHDERGFFARIACEREFRDHGLDARFVQSSVSFNRRRGTFRGMHFLTPPSTEAKLVRCVRGAIQDVLLDVRPGSASFLQSWQVTLRDQDHHAIYIPPGVAHGFQTLVDDSEVMYQMTDEYRRDLDCGYRWNDPALGIVLPEPVTVIAERDASHADFDLEAHVFRVKAGWPDGRA